MLQSERVAPFQIFALVALLLGLCGCAKTTHGTKASESLGSALSPFVEHTSTGTGLVAIAGASVTGRPIERWILGSGEKTVLIIASIHGDEAAGTPLVSRLADEMTGHPELLDGRRVVIVPAVNPDGVARHRRTNDRGVDLNRNFPASNFTPMPRNGSEPLTEPESQALCALIHEIEPDRVVSLHQPLGCIDYDGPGAELAAAMSAVCDLPVRRLGAMPGSLGSYVGLELGVPIVTVELPRAASRWSEDELWKRYGRMLIVAVRFE